MVGDLELLEAWRGGDKAAGESLVERHFSSLRRFFLNKVEDAVDDLIQTTLLSCVESRDQIREGGSFRAYMFRVARNQLYDLLRRRKRDREVLDGTLTCVEELRTSPSRAVIRQRHNRILLESMRRIPLDYQIALELHYWERLTTRELADALDVPLSTAKTRLIRGRELLQERMNEAVGSGERLETTADNLDAWAQRVRDYVDSDGRASDE